MQDSDNNEITVRKGEPGDLPQVLELIRELAAYEKASHEVENNVELMYEDGFGPDPVFGFHVALTDRRVVGLAVYYYRYSTWKGKMLYLEDLIVTSSCRRMGIGKKLFEATIEEAKKSRCRGMIWQVIEWNEPAFEFYRKYDPVIDPQWVNCRLTKDQIDSYSPVS